MKYDKQLDFFISQNVDEQYAKFHSSLVPDTKIRGVRIPVLRKIAKEFTKYDDFLGNITLDNYEAISVACYYIGLTTKDLNTLKIRLNYILPHINNWAVCDTFVNSLKLLKKKSVEFYPFLCEYLKSDNDFVCRFAIVCLMNYCLNDQTVNNIFQQVVPLQGRSYYLDMAIAWLVSVAFVKNRTQTLKLLQSKTLTKEVQNKSISKICDSFRVDDSDKLIVKKLKI